MRRAYRRWVASGVQSNLKEGEFVVFVLFPSLVWGRRFISVMMREWSDSMGLWLATWKFLICGQRYWETML